jgi:group I intron endonuclease
MGNKFSSGVYTLQNTVSGNTYVGSARSFKRRFMQHRTALRGGYHQNKHLQYAWNKYGEAAFVFKITLVCAPEHMQDYEQRLLDGLRPAYNQSRSAYSGIPVGGKCKPAHCAKVGVASKKLWATPAYRAQVTAAIQAAMTPEERAERTERAKALWANPEYRAKAVAARIGRATNAGYKCTPEQAANRQRAARISNMKRNYGAGWADEYRRRYPEYAGDVDGQ